MTGTRRSPALRTRMLAPVGAIIALAVHPAVADVNRVTPRALPNDREGVVVGWRATSGSATIALRSGRLISVHSLRRVSVGVRVRIEGIKWGSPAAGIKWSAPPRGIKWAIRWSRVSGVYTSSLRRTGRALRTPVRGVVVRRSGRGVAIGTRGGIVVVRMAVWLPAGGGKRAVWLPAGGGKRTNAFRLPRPGDTILTIVRFGRRGRLIGDGVRYVEVGRRRAIPVSGKLARVNVKARTMRISSLADPAYPLNVDLAVPTTIDMTRLPTGMDVASTATVAAGGAARTASISLNTSFEAANDPANTQVAPPPAGVQVIALIDRVVDRWTQGRAEGGVTDQMLYDDKLAQLGRVRAAAVDGNLPVARTELDGFIADVTNAVPQKVAPQVAGEVLARAGAARNSLG